MTYLLGALCIDVLERMLCLLLIVPDEVGKSRVLPCLGIDVLLHCVNVRDVVLPRARRADGNQLSGPAHGLDHPRLDRESLREPRAGEGFGREALEQIVAGHCRAERTATRISWLQ